MATSEKWLITGGGGYIGAHIADQFLTSGRDVVIYDDLSQGLKSRVEYLQKKHQRDISLIVADIRDNDSLRRTIETHLPFGIVHSAALKSVSKSMETPGLYFDVNHLATSGLLKLAEISGVRNVIFSSTAAVYGSPVQTNPIDEEFKPNPISPYGASKLAAETEVKAFISIPRNHGTCLRFFNVVGTAAPELMDNSTENLVPIVLEKIKSGKKPIVYGTDYPTPDGTCVRDYVDVRDVASAHLAAANSLANLPAVMNVGTGRGASVREVINLIGNVHGGSSPDIEESPRRPGDPAILCAQVDLIEQSLGFRAKFSLMESLESLI
jgi:UDP-glucose 4-epimerase